MNKAIIAAVLALLSFGASADTAKMCIDVNVTMADNGYRTTDGLTEDNWSTDGFKNAHGIYLEIRTGSSSGFLAWSGFTDDGFGSNGAGCTPQFLVPGSINTTYYLRISSKSKVQSNEIRGMIEGSTYNVNTTALATGKATGATLNVNFSPPSSSIKAFELMMLSSYGIYRHAGGLTDEIFYIDSESAYEDDSAYGFGKVHMGPSHTNHKYLVLHELGHNIHSWAGSADAVGGNYDLVADSEGGLRCQGSGSHKFWSLEEDRVAFKEGFAHFYAADVWNSHSQSNCVFRTWRKLQYPTCQRNDDGTWTYHASNTVMPTADCQADASDLTNPRLPSTAQPSSCTSPTTFRETFPEAFMENVCTGTIADRGVELDYLRLFWDMHTGTSPASIADIFEWFNEAWAWTNWDMYDELDNAADIVGNPVRAKWNTYSLANGVDH